MEHTSDNDLVRRCQTELPYETRAFEILLERYKDKVFRKVISMLRNRNEAEDVSQDIFLKVFTGLPSFRHDSSFSTWLYAITVNTCMNRIDKMQRRPWWWLSEDPDEIRSDVQQQEAMFYLIGQSVERRELQQRIDSTFAKISPASSEILKLRFLEELDYQTISARLNLGLSAAKMRIKRARQEFVAQFELTSEVDA